MLRLFGVLLLGAGTAYFGISLSSKLRSALQAVREMHDCLCSMRQEILFYHTPLPRILQTLSEKPGYSQRFFMLAAQKMEENRAQTAERVLNWCIDHTKDWQLPRPAQQICRRLFSSIGWMDGANQAAALAHAIAQMQQLEQQLQADYAQRSRCYRALGICCGAAVMIVLV